VCRKGVNADQCFPTYRQGTGGHTPVNSLSFVLNDGTMMIFNGFSADCTNNTELTKPIGCVRIRADINGLKPPNKVDKDIFDFYITEDKVIVRGDPLTITSKNGVFGGGYRILITGKL